MKVTDEMVDRFLRWKLPENFHPDSYITFDAERAKAMQSWPHGTCLLDAYQARAMLEHVLAVMPDEVAKAERRAITFSDIVEKQVIAMRAAVVAGKLEGLDVGMQWIANTLCGPGHLPDVDEAKALGGAQALWDKETAEHEAFRAAHPAP